MAQVKSLPQIESQLRSDPLMALKMMWAQKFNLPPNDERLSRLSEREAMEQILSMTAIVKMMTPQPTPTASTRLLGADRFASLVDEPVEVDAIESSWADEPQLTGDPEGDAWELENTL